MRWRHRRRTDEAACVLLRPAAFGRLLHQGLSGADDETFFDGHISAFAFFGGVPLAALDAIRQGRTQTRKPRSRPLPLEQSPERRNLVETCPVMKEGSLTKCPRQRILQAARALQVRAPRSRREESHA